MEDIQVIAPAFSYSQASTQEHAYLKELFKKVAKWDTKTL